MLYLLYTGHEVVCEVKYAVGKASQLHDKSNREKNAISVILYESKGWKQLGGNSELSVD